MSESQIRHEHPLEYVECRNGLTEYVCTICAQVYWQVNECK